MHGNGILDEPINERTHHIDFAVDVEMEIIMSEQTT